MYWVGSELGWKANPNTTIKDHQMAHNAYLRKSCIVWCSVWFRKRQGMIWKLQVLNLDEESQQQRQHWSHVAESKMGCSAAVSTTDFSDDIYCLLGAKLFFLEIVRAGDFTKKRFMVGLRHRRWTIQIQKH